MTKGNPKPPLAVGVDVGGTNIKAALVDADGEVIELRHQPTMAERGADVVIADIVATIEKLLDSHSAADKSVRVGLGIAGQIHRETGVLYSSPNLGWQNVPLRARLEAQLARSVLVTNDVTAATWGEWRHGAGQGLSALVCLFVGTGVGGGVVSGGRLLQGALSASAELGHVPLVFNGRSCTCRHRGCVEAYVGGWAIAERARDAVRSRDDAGNRLLELAGSAEGITAKHVSQAHRDGSPVARQLVDETADYLTAAVVGFVHMFNPARLLLSGGVIEGLPELVDRVSDGVRQSAFTAFCEGLDIRRAALGNLAGVIGAAAMAASADE